MFTQVVHWATKPFAGIAPWFARGFPLAVVTIVQVTALSDPFTILLIMLLAEVLVFSTERICLTLDTIQSRLVTSIGIAGVSTRKRSNMSGKC